MTTATTTGTTQFVVSLNVADLARSASFYRVLFGVEPATNTRARVRFEMADPPVILELRAGQTAQGGPLNHVGLRVPDSAALVAIQRRLEEAGIATQRQEGVECCYARQTKFWATDPDRNLWELYVFEEDIAHSGFEDGHHPNLPARPAVLWEHRLFDPLPAQLPHADGSVDEVRLEGTFNAALSGEQAGQFLAEVRRVLRFGGKLAIHGLTGDAPFPGKPTLPGLASLVREVPEDSVLVKMLHDAGFAGAFFEQRNPVTCFQVPGVRLHDTRLTVIRGMDRQHAKRHRVLYKGPLAEVADDEGTVFPRGRFVTVGDDTIAWLKESCADQFLQVDKP